MRAAVTVLGLGLCLLGCRDPGAVTRAELRAENRSASADLQAAYDQAEALRAQRDAAAEEGLRLREQIEGMRIQLERGPIAPPPGLADGLIGVDPERGSLYLDGLAFAKGSDALTPDGERAVARLAAALQHGELAHAAVVAIGHTDASPVSRPETVRRFGDNWGLSALRSAAVVRALQAAGVPAGRLHGRFRGPHDPRGQDPAANRRVELLLVQGG